jgi:hypothetical protein
MDSFAVIQPSARPFGEGELRWTIWKASSSVALDNLGKAEAVCYVPIHHTDRSATVAAASTCLIVPPFVRLCNRYTTDGLWVGVRRRRLSSVASRQSSTPNE